MKQTLFFSRLLLLAVLAASASLYAQNSEVSGRVFDASKGAISGAQVTLIRTTTGDRREAVSSAEGYYIFPVAGAGRLRSERQQRRI